MRKKACIRAGLAICAAGILVFLYPDFREMRTRQEVANIIEKFEKLYPEGEQTGVSPLSDSDESPLEETMPYLALYEEMQSYNAQLCEGGQEIRDAFSYEESPVGFTSLEENSYLIGYIEIPSIECELPLFIGANTANLARGAAVMGNTSMPVGGENTNCAIAAHRGYRGSAYFRNIISIGEGDLVYVTNPWGTLVYQAVSSEIIDPSDTNPLAIEEGQDILTLVSCHPYTIGGGAGQRYIVRCERVDTPPLQEKTTEERPVNSDNSTENSRIRDTAPEESLMMAEDLIRYSLPPVLIVTALILVFRKPT